MDSFSGRIAAICIAEFYRGRGAVAGGHVRREGFVSDGLCTTEIGGSERMTEPQAVRLTEDRIPLEGMEESITNLVELYGGEMTNERDRERAFTLPLRRGQAGGGGVACTLSWAPSDAGDATVTLSCDRDVDAPKFQRVLLLVAGVGGAILFMLWPFYPGQKEFGTLAWLGGVIAISVYLMTLRRTSGGIAFDFLQRLAAWQREREQDEAAEKVV